MSSESLHNLGRKSVLFGIVYTTSSWPPGVSTPDPGQKSVRLPIIPQWVTASDLEPGQE